MLLKMVYHKKCILGIVCWKLHRCQPRNNILHESGTVCLKRVGFNRDNT